MVLGLRLGVGDKLGNAPYWTLSAVERERVRMAFMRALRYVDAILPFPGHANGQLQSGGQERVCTSSAQFR